MPSFMNIGQCAHILNIFQDPGVIDGYNAFLNELLKIEDESRLHLVKFDRHVHVVHRDLPLDNVPLMHNGSYKPIVRYTALLDAIGDGIKTVDETTKVDERAIVIIITDGDENSSNRYTKEQIRQMIADRTARGDWSFIYIGEFAQRFAVEMGISPKNAVNFCHEKGKIKANLEAASVACTNLRSYKMRASDALLNN